MGWRATWIDAGLGCLAPDPCCACDRTAGTAAGWCDDCFASLPWQGSDRCGFCLLPLAGGVCASCRREPWDTARVAVEYGTPVPAMVGRWKFRPDAVLSRSLAAVVEEGIARDPALGRIDLVTCVPQPAAAWGRRGFSPALDLARVVARATRAPLGHPLRRTRRAPPQVGLTARERDRNVRRLFRVPPWRRHAIGGRSVVLVDDVLTTGSTVRACARALRAAGAARVDLVALARAHHA